MFTQYQIQDTTDSFIESTSYRDDVDLVITQPRNAFFYLRLDSLPRNVAESSSTKSLLKQDRWFVSACFITGLWGDDEKK